MFLNAFDAIYVINLRRRADRRAEMLQELQRMGLVDDPRVRFFEAIEVADPGPFSLKGAHGCYLSHLSILEAEASHLRPILILEDDCVFRREALEYQMPTQWDVFYGGYSAEKPDELSISPIIGAHCMGYSAEAVRCAAKYLRDLLDRDFPPDPKAAAEPGFDPNIKPPFDGAVVWFRRANPQLTTVFAQIAVQRSSRSDIALAHPLDRILPSFVARMRRVKNFMKQLYE